MDPVRSTEAPLFYFFSQIRWCRHQPTVLTVCWCVISCHMMTVLWGTVWCCLTNTPRFHDDYIMSLWNSWQAALEVGKICMLELFCSCYAFASLDTAIMLLVSVLMKNTMTVYDCVSSFISCRFAFFLHAPSRSDRFLWSKLLIGILCDLVKRGLLWGQKEFWIWICLSPATELCLMPGLSRAKSLLLIYFHPIWTAHKCICHLVVSNSLFCALLRLNNFHV